MNSFEKFGKLSKGVVLTTALTAAAMANSNEAFSQRITHAKRKPRPPTMEAESHFNFGQYIYKADLKPHFPHVKGLEKVRTNGGQDYIQLPEGFGETVKEFIAQNPDIEKKDTLLLANKAKVINDKGQTYYFVVPEDATHPQFFYFCGMRKEGGHDAPRNVGGARWVEGMAGDGLQHDPKVLTGSDDAEDRPTETLQKYFVKNHNETVPHTKK